MNDEVKQVIVCDHCHKPYATWHYANNCNSSKFCDVCGTYCSTKRLYDYEIKRYNEMHEEYLKKESND